MHLRGVRTYRLTRYTTAVTYSNMILARCQVMTWCQRNRLLCVQGAPKKLRRFAPRDVRAVALHGERRCFDLGTPFLAVEEADCIVLIVYFACPE